MKAVKRNPQVVFEETVECGAMSLDPGAENYYLHFIYVATDFSGNIFRDRRTKKSLRVSCACSEEMTP